MRLLEFQAKEVFSEYGISLLKGAVSTDIGKAREDAKMIGYPMVVKSQVPVGGRGKAGGIQICKNADELSIKYPQVMELEIKGERARAILIEEQLCGKIGDADIDPSYASVMPKCSSTILVVGPPMISTGVKLQVKGVQNPRIFYACLQTYVSVSRILELCSTDHAGPQAFAV